MRGVGSPYALPPGTPARIVSTLRTAMDKIFADPEFPVYYEKLTAEEVSPLGAQELTAVVQGIPRDTETLAFLKKFAGAGPLPPR
jgi:tripartite-type tricarboxylate transporter receptor subunit TctC